MQHRASGGRGSQGGEVEGEGVVAMDGGKVSLDGEGMQAGRQHGEVVLILDWGGSQNCKGEALWQLLKHLQHRDNDLFPANATLRNK
jgi:hypothetical protein